MERILIVDPYESVLAGTKLFVKQQYPQAKITTARTAEEVKNLISTETYDVIITELSISSHGKEDKHIDTGLNMLKWLMQNNPSQHIVVQSSHTNALSRLKPMIDEHQGGFTIADKTLSKEEMMTRVDWAIKGLIYMPVSLRTKLEIKAEWLELVKLSFQEGLTDKAIAQHLNVSERTVRHYWTRLQDALEVYPDVGINIRIKTQLQARKKGLID